MEPRLQAGPCASLRQSSRLTSEVPALLVVIALVHQWATQDRRLAKRRDRHADTYDDDELTAYNRMLSELSRDR